jgi:hypothetical protein
VVVVSGIEVVVVVVVEVEVVVSVREVMIVVVLVCDFPDFMALGMLVLVVVRTVWFVPLTAAVVFDEEGGSVGDFVLQLKYKVKAPKIRIKTRRK